MVAGSGFTGDDRLYRMLERSPGNARRGLQFALRAEGERIMGRAKLRTPVDTGALRASGHVQPPVVGAGTVTVTLGYGGAASAYALIQHEEESFRHNVGEHHYLSKSVEEAGPGFGDRLTSYVAAYRVFQ